MREDVRKCPTVECDSRGTSGLRRSRRWPGSDHETAGSPAFLDIFLIVNFVLFVFFLAEKSNAVLSLRVKAFSPMKGVATSWWYGWH